jgi:hypothetical protein
LSVDAWAAVALNAGVRLFLRLFIGVLVGAAGCASKPAPRAGSGSTPGLTEPAATPVRVLLGRVIAVNVTGQFVVIDFAPGAMPTTGRRMQVVRQGQKVGEVRISGPSRNFNIAADILAGEAAVGDEVRDP